MNLIANHESIAANTERLVNDMLPTLYGSQGVAEVTRQYHSFIPELKSMTANDTPLNWEVIHDAARAVHGEHNQAVQAAVAAVANNTVTGFWGTPRRMAVSMAAPLFGQEGTYVAVDNTGQVLASQHIENPVVPKEYGIADPWPFYKLAEARVVHEHGLDPLKNPGYAVLKALKQQALPHLGHAVSANEDGSWMACGTTGRTLSPLARGLIVQQRPDIAARFVGQEPHPDDLAGYIDSKSGYGVLLALRRARYGEVIPMSCNEVTLDDPNAPEHVGVDWN